MKFRVRRVFVGQTAHEFFAPLLTIRAVMGFRHSKREPGSNEMHCRHACKSALHFGHELSMPMFPVTVAPHVAHFTFSAKAIIRGERGPSRSRGVDCHFGCCSRARSSSM